MKNLVYAFSLLFLISCNPLKTLTNGETDLDKDFFEGEGNGDLYHNLVSFWRFDETGSTDSRLDTNSQNNLDYSIGAISSTSGQIGNALDCNSIDPSNHFLLNSSNNLGFGNNTDFTIAFWIYVDTFTAGKYVAYFIDHNITLSGSSDVTFWLNAITASVSISTGSWQHIAFVVDRDSGVNSYLNGGWQHSTGNVSNGVNIADSGFTICSLNDWTANLEGRIDSFGIWNRQLSDSEISDLYNGYNNLD